MSFDYPGLSPAVGTEAAAEMGTSARPAGSSLVILYHFIVYTEGAGSPCWPTRLRLGRRMSCEMTNWALKLSRVVAPIRSDPLRTLADARAYILSLPPGTRHQDDWQRAADLLMAAVDSSSAADIEQATFQLERVLLLYRLLAPR
jgi:hypothetical protein